MSSRAIACAASVLLPMLMAGCASAPTAPPRQPDAPAEMMTPAPPPGYFVTRIEQILSRQPEKQKP